MHDTNIHLDFFRKTIRMGNKLRRVAAQNLSLQGYTWNQFDVLRIIRPGCSYTASELTEKSVRLNSNLSPILNNFEKSGLIERVRDSEDRRIVRTRLTQKGITERERILSLQRAYMTDKLKAVDTALIHQLLPVMERITQQLVACGVFNRCGSSDTSERR